MLRLPFFALALAISFVGCVAPGGAPRATGPWRLQWNVDVQEMSVGDDPTPVWRVPRFEGAEIWWVDDDRVVLESYGREAGAERGASRTWILPGVAVVTLNLRSGRAARIPFARWIEERLRTQRASMIETVRVRRETGDPEAFAYFTGDLRRRDHRDGSGREWETLTALPGRVWRFYGRSPEAGPWANELLPLAFEGVTPDLAAALTAPLADIAPRFAEDVAIPSDGRTILVRRRLRRVDRLGATDEIPRLPEAPGSQEDLDFTTLWGHLVDPDTRPEGLDRRGVRVRLEATIEASHLPRLRDRILHAEDLEELEELEHLFFAADPAEFDRDLDIARKTHDLPRVLAQVSVLSLRRPAGLAALVDEILEDPPLWEGLSEDQSEESRTWLAGVAEWVRVREEALARGTVFSDL